MFSRIRSKSLLLLATLPLVGASFGSFAEVVGLSAGEFRVDESGGATYNMPISTPAGTAGVAPQLALSYSSNNRQEGALGVGWSLSGLSSITRCPQTPVHDNGHIQAVQYDSEDKFCLDGQRLLLKSGTYGAPNSTYRTEVDNFSIVTAKQGSSTNGPLYFEVKNKAGETHYYGDSDSISSSFSDHSDAFIEPGGYSAGVLARSWAIKVIKDVKNNYILFNYNKDTTAGSFYIDNIQYTGNLSTGAAPYARVDFVYTDHSKGFKGYMAGAHLYHDKRLTRIDTKVDGDHYRSYFLNYESSDFIEERTLLTSVQECPDNDSNMSNCLPATNFNWQRPSLATSGTTWVCEQEPFVVAEDQQIQRALPEEFCWEEPTTTNFRPYPNYRTLATSTANRDTTQVIDINGDGYQDLVYVNGSLWYTKLGPSHSTAYSLTGIGDGKKEYAMSIDYNGDGVRDLLVADSSTSNWYAVSYQPSQVTGMICPKYEPCEEYTYTSNKTVKNLGIVATGLEGQAQVMDVNGDGNEDIVFRSGSYLKAHINDGDGTFTANQVLYTFGGSVSSSNLNDGYTSQTASMKSASAIDINGDGRSDLIARVTTSTTYQDDFCDGEIPLHNEKNETKGAQRYWDDCRPYTVTSSSYQLFVSSGDASSPQLTMVQNLGSSSMNTLRIADLNGDGLSDLLYVLSDRWYYRLSDGTQLLAARDAGLTTSSSKKYLSQFIDLNGDGRTDILHASSSSYWSIYFSRPTASGDWVSLQNRGSMSFGSNAAIRFGDTTGDGKINLLTSTDSSWREYYNRLNIKEYVIDTITNGNGIKTDITYKPMTDSSVYVFPASDADINSDTVSPMSGNQLVSRVTTDSNVGSSVAVSYQYGGLLVHKKGRGSLGFQMLRTTDEQSGVVTETQYSQAHDSAEFSTARMPLYTERRLNNKLLSTSSNIVAVRSTAQGGVMPYVSSSTDKAYIYGSDGVSTLASTTVSSNTYDSWGNLTNNTITVTDAATGEYRSTAIVNSYGNSTEQQYGRLKSTSITKNATGDTGNAARQTTYSYNSDMLLSGTVVSPNSVATKLTTSFSYDSYGNKTQVSVTGYSTATGSNQTRTSKTIYDSRGRFVNYTENAKGERVNFLYNGLSASSFSGTLTSTKRTGANGIYTWEYYDAFGQVTSIDHPDSRTTTINRAYCSGCVTNSHYKITTTESGSPDKIVYYDKWGREIATSTKGFNGATISSTMVYDGQGRQWKTYEPNSSDYTSLSYDSLGRISQVTQPNGSTLSKSVYGLETRSINELNQVSKSFINGFGEVEHTEDELGNTVTFKYDAYGNVLQTTTRADGKNSVVSVTYDLWGRKVQTNDPVKGVWTYTYNAFGEMVSQKTARNHTFSYSYDQMGRKIRSYQANEGTLCWNYGTTGNASVKAAGKLMSTAKYEGSSVACNTSATATIKKTFSYDSLGRPSSTVTAIDGINYTQSQTYDSYSRPLVTTFPTGTASFAVKNVYNSYGYMAEQRNNATNALLRRVDSMTSRGQVATETLGNGVVTSRNYLSDSGWLQSIDVRKSGVLKQYVDVTYDNAGNVKSRESQYGTSYGTGSHYTESYNYDSLNRLSSRTIAVSAGSTALPASFKTTQTYNLDGWGNFTYKTGAGYYKYDATKVHKLLGVYSNSNYTGTLYSFSYDNNGNVTNDGSRAFTYGSFDKPTSITLSGVSSTMRYGVERELYFKQDNYSENGTNVTYSTTYVSGYEKVVRSGGKGALTEHKYYVGDMVYTQRSNNSTDTFYLHKDHQGSVIATTNGAGNVISQAIYDPYGKRTSVYLESYFAAFNVSEPTEQGYTGHTQMDELDLIHMGGRIYDPTLGRFMQADSFVQAPKNSQSYNRYAYVLNNPMSYTDPSGYFFKSLFKKLNKMLGKFAPFVGLALLLIPGVGAWAAATWYNAAAFGFITGGIATGSLKGALIGAISGAAFQQIGSAFNADKGFWTQGGPAHVGAHAVTGGITSTLQGGKFGHGFFSAGLTKAFNVNELIPGVRDGANSLRTISAALIGGTISALTGGKFANGAATAGLAQAVNGNSFWNKAKELGEFAAGFLPGADLVGCVSDGCSYLEWSMAVGEVAFAVAGGGAVTAVYKVWKRSRHLMNTDKIRFTQDSIGARFRDKTSVQNLINDLQSGKISPADVEAIRIFKQDGLTFTLDNRRLFAAHQAGVKVNTVQASVADVANEAWKMTTRNQGTIIGIRGKL